LQPSFLGECAQAAIILFAFRIWKAKRAFSARMLAPNQGIGREGHEFDLGEYRKKFVSAEGVPHDTGTIGRFVMRLASKMVGDARSFFVFEDYCELLVVFLRRRYAITVSSAELSDAYRTLFTAERIGEFPLFETLRERFAN
jgi:hypothetical protein